MKMNSNSTVPTVLIVALLLFAPLGSGAASANADGPKILQRVISWSSEGSQPQGLHIVRVSHTKLTERLFFLPDRGRGLIVTSSLDAVQGTTTRTVLDDASGWWARLTTKYGFQADSLDKFFGLSHAADESSPEILCFETSAGAKVEISSSTAGTYDLPSLVLKTLEKEGLASTVVGSIPELTRESLRFLGASLGDVHSAVSPGPIRGDSSDPLLIVLSRAINNEMGGRGLAPAPMMLVEMTKGSNTTTATEELLRRFASIDRAVPLSSLIGGPGDS
jgi:hypothetical protein